MELVETQKPGLVENRRGGERDHIAVGDFAARDILPKAVDPLVHLGHEFVKMRAAFVRHRALLKKQSRELGEGAMVKGQAGGKGGASGRLTPSVRRNPRPHRARRRWTPGTRTARTAMP